MSGKYSFSDIQDRRREDRRPKSKKIIYAISKFTKKALSDNEHYRILRAKYLQENTICKRCGGKSTQVHHKKGRGIWLLIEKYWLAVCANCHKWIEENPAEAKEKGLSLNRIN